MRKIYIAVAALVAVAGLAGCGGKDKAEVTAPAASPAAVHASEPTADTSGEVPTNGDTVSPTDLSGVKVSRVSEDSGVPGQDTVSVDFTIKNSATYAVTFYVTIGIYDANGDQATAVSVDTGASGYGPTLPGKTLHVSGKWIAGGKVPTGRITAEVTEVKRQPA